MEEFKRKSAVAVLSALGSDVFHSLEQRLRRDFEINLNTHDDYTLEELHIALRRLFGADGSAMLMGEIHREIEKSSRAGTLVSAE